MNRIKHKLIGAAVALLVTTLPLAAHQGESVHQHIGYDTNAAHVITNAWTGNPVVDYWQAQVNYSLTTNELIEIWASGLTNRVSKYRIKVAMTNYWHGHKRCEACRTPHSQYKTLAGAWKRNEVHHYRIQSRAPWLAADPLNFITLCRHCHGWWGHGIANGGAWAVENTNLRETMKGLRVLYDNVPRWSEKPKRKRRVEE